MTVSSSMIFQEVLRLECFPEGRRHVFLFLQNGQWQEEPIYDEKKEKDSKEPLVELSPQVCGEASKVKVFVQPALFETNPPLKNFTPEEFKEAIFKAKKDI